jgi:hypothetical protein
MIKETSMSLNRADPILDYVDQIDFEHQKAKMGRLEDGLGWSRRRLAFYERQYRNWLYLNRKYPDEELPPSPGIDQFWHYHMLDSRAYFRDCEAIFGTYLHHNPYVGIDGPEDHERLLRLWENTQRRYREEFGEPIYEYPGD